MIQIGYFQDQLYDLKLENIMMKIQYVVLDREESGQVVDWIIQVSLVVDLVVDQVDGVNRDVRKLIRWQKINLKQKLIKKLG